MKPFTYFIGWSDLNTFYYGRRTQNGCHPDELWKSYFTSSKYVREFRRKHGEPDIVQVRKTFSSVEKCKKWECDVLERMNAQGDPRFLNRRNGDIKWDTTGLVTVRFNDETCGMVSTTDPRYLSGELMSVTNGRKHKHPNTKNRGTVTVKDHDGNYYRVPKTDPRYLSGDLVGVNHGMVPVKDSAGNTFLIDKNDVRFLSGELIHVSKGMKQPKTKGMVTVRGPDGTCFNVPLDDQRYLSGELISAAKGIPKKTKTYRGEDPSITCPHCGKAGGERIMKRWHFDNCKKAVI